MSARDKRYPMAVLGIALGGYAVAMTRAGAQVLEDAELHATAALCAFGFALGVFFAGSRAAQPVELEKRGAARALTLTAWLMPIGTSVWLRFADLGARSDLASVATAASLALPLATAGYASARGLALDARGYAQLLAFGGLGAAGASALLGAIGLEQLVAQAFLLFAFAALNASHTPEVRRFSALWFSSGTGFLVALALALWARQVFPVPEQAAPFGAPAAANERLRPQGFALSPLDDAWDSAGHVEAFEIVAQAELKGTGSAALVRDSSLIGPLALEPSAIPSCAGTLLGTAFAGHPSRVLLAGLASGGELACALEQAPDTLDVAEPSRALQAVLREPIARFMRTAKRSTQVSVRLVSARSFVRGEKRYDRIVFATRRTKHRLPAAALPLPEALLETDRGFAQLLAALSEGGVIYVLAVDEPVALRIVTTAIAALRSAGEAKPENQIVVHMSHGMYLVRIQRTPFTLDDILALHAAQRATSRAPMLPYSDQFGTALWGGLYGAPELVYTPGAPFLNRFGMLLAHPNDLAAFQAKYVFDISPPTDDRPLFGELSRHESASAWFFGGEGGALGWLATLLPALSFLLIGFAPVAPPATPRATRSAWLALVCLGAAAVFVFAFVVHSLSIWLPRAEQSFVLCALAGAPGAALGLGYGRRALGSRNPLLLVHALALVLLALASVALGPLFGSALLHLALGPAFAFGLLFMLGLCASAWRNAATSPARDFGAALLGAASAFPLASGFALLAGYAAVAAVASGSLALPTLLALRRAALLRR